MKKSLLLLTLFMILTSCVHYGEVKYNINSSKNATTLTMLYKHSSMEKQGEFENKFTSVSTYYREIKSGVKAPVRITFKIDALENFNTLKPQGVVRVNKKTFPLNITGITSQLKTDAPASKSQGGKYSAKPQAQRWKAISGTATIPPNVEQEILKSRFFAFRLYIDSTPITFIVKRNDLSKIKSFLGATQDYVPR